MTRRMSNCRLCRLACVSAALTAAQFAWTPRCIAAPVQSVTASGVMVPMSGAAAAVPAMAVPAMAVPVMAVPVMAVPAATVPRQGGAPVPAGSNDDGATLSAPDMSLYRSRLAAIQQQAFNQSPAGVAAAASAPPAPAGDAVPAGVAAPRKIRKTPPVSQVQPYLVNLAGMGDDLKARIALPGYGEVTVQEGDLLPNHWRVKSIDDDGVVAQVYPGHRTQRIAYQFMPARMQSQPEDDVPAEPAMPQRTSMPFAPSANPAHTTPLARAYSLGQRTASAGAVPAPLTSPVPPALRQASVKAQAAAPEQSLPASVAALLASVNAPDSTAQHVSLDARPATQATAQAVPQVAPQVAPQAAASEAAGPRSAAPFTGSEPVAPGSKSKPKPMSKPKNRPHRAAHCAGHCLQHHPDAP